MNYKITNIMATPIPQSLNIKHCHTESAKFEGNGVWPLGKVVSPGKVHGDGSLLDVLEDGDCLAVGHPLQGHPIHRQDLVSWTHEESANNYNSCFTFKQQKALYSDL